MALAAVVFPIPISPQATKSIFCSESSLANSIPLLIHVSACSTVMADRRAKFSVPEAILMDRNFGWLGNADITPVSTTMISD